MKNSTLLTSDQIIKDLLPQKFGKPGMIWTAILVFICLIGAFAYYRQLRYGLIVTNMRDYVSWGIYISNFVFYVAMEYTAHKDRRNNCSFCHHLRFYYYHS